MHKCFYESYGARLTSTMTLFFKIKKIQNLLLEFPESEDLQSLEDFLVIEELTRLVDNLEHEVSESSYEIVKLKSENKNLKLKNGILAAINDEDQKEIERLR